MTQALSEINWLAVLAASAAHFVLGGIWFTALFGRHYAAALELATQPPQKPRPAALFGPLICGAVIVSTTAFLLRALAVATMSDALVLGAIVGIGYLGAMTVNIAINPLFPRPFRYALVNAPMFVIGSIMSSAILAAMG